MSKCGDNNYFVWKTVTQTRDKQLAGVASGCRRWGWEGGRRFRETGGKKKTKSEGREMERGETDKGECAGFRERVK